MIANCEKCGTAEAKLDVAADKVICTTCKGEVAVTSFMKQMMKSNHDILEKNDIMLPPNGILTSCENTHCQQSFSAEVDDVKDTVTCPYCKKEANISIITKNMLRENRLFVGATKAYFDQEGKEAVSPQEHAKQMAALAAEATGGQIEVSTADVGKIEDIFSAAPDPEVVQRVKDVHAEVASKSASKDPAFRRAS